MKKRAIKKEFHREIKKSRSRFLSIMMIVALGVAFFSGIQSSAPDMRVTEDSYFDDSDLMDIRVIGTLGLTDGDLEAIAGVEGVAAAEGAYMEDVYSGGGESQTVLHVESFPDTMNQVAVAEGSLPEEAGECFLDAAYAEEMGYGVGDTLEIDVEDEDDSILVSRAYTIAGIGYSPCYIANQRGSSTLGTGTVSGFVFVAAEEFDTDVYSVVYVQVEGAKEEMAYTDAYDDLVEEVLERIEAIEDVRCETRYTEVVGEAEAELADARQEVEDGKQELADAKAELADAKEELEAGKAEAESELDEAESELLEAEAELADGKQELEDSKAEVEDAENEAADGEAELDDSESTLASAQSQIADALDTLNTSESEYQSALSEYESEAAEAEAELEEAQEEIDSGSARVSAGWAEYQEGLEQVLSAEEQITTAQAQLSDAQTAYEQGAAELEESQNVYDESAAELASGQEAIAAAKEELEAQQSAYESGREALDAAWESYDSAVSELASGQSAYDAAAEQVEALRTGYNEAAAAVSSAQTASDAAADQVAVLTSEIAALNEKIAGLESLGETGELEDARERLSQKQAELEEADTQAAALSQALSDAQTTASALQSQLASAESALSEQKAALDTSSATLAATKAELEAQESALDEAKEAFDTESAQIAEKEQDLAEGEEQLAEAKIQIEEGQKELEETALQLASAQAELDAQKQEVSEAWDTLAASKEQLEASESELASAQEEVDDGYEELESAGDQLASARSELDSGWEEYESSLSEYNSGVSQLSEGRQQLSDARGQILDALDQIAEAESEIEENEQKIADGWDDYEEGKAEAEQEVADAEQEIADAEQEIADAEQEIADAEAEIADAEAELSDISYPDWYVYDRSSLPENTGYGENAERMTNIAQVFPVIFFLVAALISLTTMTRMVEEERTQIGTLKALGYGKWDIAKKYLKYAFLATLFGSVFGMLFGEKVFPWVIIRAYQIVYIYQPAILLPYNWGYGLAASGISLLCTMGAALSACYRALGTVPAELMRPPSPKQGKRVLLEHIPFIWKHLSFTWKSTVRNLMRYKKRFLMTVLGIGGCMGLLLVGYGLQDSIGDVGEKQYDELQTYDAILVYDDEADADDMEELEHSVVSDERITEWKRFYMQSMDIAGQDASGTGKQWSIYLYVPEDTDNIEDFLTFRSRTDGEEYTLTDEGAIITEKIATEFDLSIGDTLSLALDEGGTVEIPIAEICENYLYHYIYLTPTLYEAVFGEAPEYNSIFFCTEDGQAKESLETLEQIGAELLSCDAALSITYTENLRETIQNMLGALDLVIIVLIVSAGLLAFVVLYNLNNININERLRELATLKVLGFYDGEVSAYIYRENILITLIGAGAGCLIGKVLHAFIITTVEVDSCMFGRTIYTSSYLYGTLFTFAFSVIVNLAMHFRLKKIDMVESLKSIE
ncbi:MAG: FtsX-like permease family protein [Lachnospiraceae bacterium]|nr:FtsX-like permease family protein [Lachnospiraceae bacterium]